MLRDLDIKKIVQGPLELYIIKRQSFVHIFWSKRKFPELTVFAMLNLLHYQLISSLTGQINAIIEENQSYDPTVNFGKGNAVQNLLNYTIETSLNSFAITLDQLPTLSLNAGLRNTLLGHLKKIKDLEGFEANLLLSRSQVISFYKKKGFNLSNKDIFLFFNLFQAKPSLMEIESWFPITLPGVDDE